MSRRDDFSREYYESKSMVKVRYGGLCNGCGTPTQSTPKQTPEANHDRAWIRCRDCGSVTLCSQADSEHADAGDEGQQ